MCHSPFRAWLRASPFCARLCAIAPSSSLPIVVKRQISIAVLLCWQNGLGCQPSLLLLLPALTFAKPFRCQLSWQYRIAVATRRWTLPPLSPLAASAFLTYFRRSQPSICHSFPSLLSPSQSAR
ncbi:hypothetical protein GW17_00026649 [Ensete ventricosum]|nr:hypothetical protein GW17_00026649 [Ensete ventricosum]RZS21318.1 hypothetical protein BHM03_00053944 [Ensete ventricosum]